MTAQEAAQKAKDGWRAVSGWSVVIFAVSGIAGIVVARKFSEGWGWLTDPSAGALALSAIQYAVKKCSDVSAKVLPTEVAGQLGGPIEDLQKAMIQTSTVVMQLSNQMSQGEIRREQMHAENTGRNEEFNERLDEHGRAINSLGEAMASLKQGWQMTPVKGREKR